MIYLIVYGEISYLNLCRRNINNGRCDELFNVVLFKLFVIFENEKIEKLEWRFFNEEDFWLVLINK